MPILIADCPRCSTKRITFDVAGANSIGFRSDTLNIYEIFCICRHCGRSTTFILRERKDDFRYRTVRETGILNLSGALNEYLSVEDFVSLKDLSAAAPPEYISENIKAIFKEGATCLAVGCYNAAGTMFRLSIDIATRSMLPDNEVVGLKFKTRRYLGFRLPWLFDNGYLPDSLKELSSCIKEDGNDGAHAGNLTKPDAEDLLDFTTALLERIYTEPERLRLAKERREARRAKKA